jgi:uncharacterized surface protein with fasciclin (FAS1) repeats
MDMFKNAKSQVSLVLAFVLLVLGGTAALAASPVEQADQTVVEIAVSDGRFETLVAALQAAGLVDTLSGEGPFTVFAPTDDAFEALPAGALDSLLADTDALTEVLLYHVVPGNVLAEQVVTLESADTVLGEPVTITVSGSTVKVNDANVIITDIQGSNGVIHVIDAVLIPPVEEVPATLPVSGGEVPSSSNIMLFVALGTLLLVAGLGLRYYLSGQVS